MASWGSDDFCNGEDYFNKVAEVCFGVALDYQPKDLWKCHSEGLVAEVEEQFARPWDTDSFDALEIRFFQSENKFMHVRQLGKTEGEDREVWLQFIIKDSVQRDSDISLGSP